MASKGTRCKEEQISRSRRSIITGDPGDVDASRPCEDWGKGGIGEEEFEDHAIL